MTLVRVGNKGFLFPPFVHEFGDSAHHISMVRTCEFDDYGAPIRGTGPSDLRFFIHEFLDDNVFYPILHWLRDWVGDNDVYDVLRAILGFFWGLNCGYPARDVALYTVWYLRGCKPIEVFTFQGGM